MATRRRWAILGAVLVATTLYATVRYNVCKGVPWAHWPLYVTNKALAWSSVTLLLVGALQALRGRVAKGALPAFVDGAALAGAHVLASLALLAPARYPDLFAVDGGFTLAGELTILAGVLASLALAAARRSVVALPALGVAVAVHVALLGSAGWLTPEKWPGYLVPITLLAFVTAAALVVVSVVAIRRARY